MRAGEVLIFERHNIDDDNVSAPDPVDVVLGGEGGAHKANVDVETQFSVSVSGGAGVVKRYFTRATYF